MKKLVWRKKLLAILATAALGAALTGCGSQSANATSAGNAGNTGNTDNTDSDTTASDTNADNQTQVRVVKGVTGGSLAPYMYIDENNELTGVDIEIAKEVFNRIPEYDLEIEIADALQGVLSGQYDIAINNYGYTDARAETYYFSYPYKTTFNVYLQRSDDTPLTSLQDIADRDYKIEVGAGSLTANALEQWNADNPEHQINIIYTEADFQVKFGHLVDQTTDVAIDDGPIVDTLLENFGLEGQLVGNEIDPETEDFLFPQNNTYFLFGKNDDGYEIREKVNAALKEMKEDGTLAELTSKYFNRDTSPKAEYFESTKN